MVCSGLYDLCAVGYSSLLVDGTSRYDLEEYGSVCTVVCAPQITIWHVGKLNKNGMLQQASVLLLSLHWVPRPLFKEGLPSVNVSES